MGGLAQKLVAKFILVFKTFEALLMQLFLNRFEMIVTKVYKRAGIIINGKNPWDITNLTDKSFYVRVANNAPLGLGETYVEGLWECKDIAEFSRRIFESGIYRFYYEKNPLNKFLNWFELCFFNLQSKSQAWEVGQKHYDLGNDLFESFLDPAMTYSCGYWKTAKTLEQAQIDKMDLIARKMMLKPGMTVLDIGCGWGGLCKYLAKNYGVKVVGITISKEGARYAQDVCKGLPVEIRLIDYRDLNEKFDRIVSVGMFEHVGRHNYSEFFSTAERCLKDDGIFLLHTIGINDPNIPLSEPWFHKYIFQNGMLPYYRYICDNIEGKFIIEDWHNFGNDYSKTLLAWLDNFKKNWISSGISFKYGDRFYRMWTYYFQFCAGGFLARKFQLYQIVLSKNGIKGGYYAPR